jgi:ketosteroid isomerase-like protein
MSEENLDLARRFIELGRQGDWSRLDLLAEDVVYRPISEIADAGEYLGPEGFRRYMASFFESEWAKGLTFEATSFRDFGQAVLVRLQLSGHGRVSGLEFAARVFEVLIFAGGEIIRIEDFLDRDEAEAKARGAAASGNVALVQRAIGDLEALFELFDEEIVWDSTAYERPQFPEFSGVRRGKQTVTRNIRSYVGAWQDFTLAVEETIDGGNSVVLGVHETMRGRTSGVPIEHRYFQVWTFREGRIIRGASFTSKADALASLGLGP